MPGARRDSPALPSTPDLWDPTKPARKAAKPAATLLSPESARPRIAPRELRPDIPRWLRGMADIPLRRHRPLRLFAAVETGDLPASHRCLSDKPPGQARPL